MGRSRSQPACADIPRATRAPARPALRRLGLLLALALTPAWLMPPDAGAQEVVLEPIRAMQPASGRKDVAFPERGGVREQDAAGQGAQDDAAQPHAGQGAQDADAQDAAEEVVELSPVRAVEPEAQGGQRSAEQDQASARDEDEAALAGIADEPADPALTPQPGNVLYLEVRLNGHPTNLIGEFLLLAGNRFALRVREMRELGMVPPAAASDDDIIPLDDLAAEWSYDETRQLIDIRLPVNRIRPQVLDLSGRAAKEDLKLTPSGTGLVLNYSALASARAEDTFTRAAFDGVSVNLDGWVYSPYGSIFGSGFVRADELRRVTAVRLDTSWRFVDAKRAMDYTVGDIITSGPAWARPVRLGGVRVARSFKLRPDVITTPLPSISGSAAVPTVLDVYVNNIRVHSGEISPGPFEIHNIPAISSAGVARVVMRDAAGKEIVTEKKFFSSPQLMRAGLLEFSAQAGVPRLNYGSKSFDYAFRHPAAIASARYGLTDRITVHGHAEASGKLALAGAGATFSVFDTGVLSLAAAASHSTRGTGFLTHASLQAYLFGVNVQASYTRAWKQYHDLASISAERAALKAPGAVFSGAAYPREVGSLSLGYVLPGIGGSISATFVHARTDGGDKTQNLGLSYSQMIFKDVSVYLHVSADIKKLDAPTIFAGLTIPLGGKGTVSAGGSYDVAGRYRANLSYSKPLGLKEGSVGWKARVTYGDLKSVQASLAWRGSAATVRGTAMQIDKATLAQVNVDGAFILADNALFATNRVHDSFAIVNAGAPGVRVRYENREVGKTRADGHLLVTTLRSLQRNKISIDAETLPVDAIVDTDKAYVVPAVRAGVVVNFKTRRFNDAAIVAFVDARGKPLQAGGEVRLEGVEEVFMVGYDGEAFLQGLKKSNTARIRTEEGECVATFSFAPSKDGQTFIGPVKCLPAGGA